MDLQNFPPLYQMDDYLSCTQDETNYFCDIQAKLKTSNENYYTNNIIKEVSENLMTFDRTVIHRAFCIPSNKTLNKSIMYPFITDNINKHLQHFKFTATVNDTICTEVKPNLSLYDLLCLATAIIYLLLILIATYQEHTRRYQKVKIQEHHPMDYLIRNLSLYSTWKHRTAVPKNLDYRKLLSIQGIRFFSMIILIINHVFFLTTHSYIFNIVDYEKLLSSWLLTLLRVSSLFLVLPFFLFSSWLLTVQVYNIVEEYGELSLKNMAILIINRYVRLIVPFAVLLIFIHSSWILKIAGPCNFSLIVLNRQACTKNWLSSILLISNYDHIFNICHPVSWYISADFQLYVLNLFVLYLKFKFKLEEIKLYTGTLCLSCTIHAAVLCVYSDTIFKPTLRSMEGIRFSTSYVVSYMSITSIWSSSFIGVIFGHLYQKSKKTVIKKTRLLTGLWSFIFLLLPLLTIYISYTEYTGSKAVILECLIKPLYNLGIGLGVYGMSHGFGVILKNLLESKFVIFLSNFIYCVYLTHSGVIMSINSYVSSPLLLTEIKLLLDCIITLILSFICGIFITLTVEEPGAMIQKQYLPQLGKWTKGKTK